MKYCVLWKMSEIWARYVCFGKHHYKASKVRCSSWQPVVTMNMFQSGFRGIWFWICGICIRMCCLRATSPCKSHVYLSAVHLVVVFHKCSEILPGRLVSCIICFLSFLSLCSSTQFFHSHWLWIHIQNTLTSTIFHYWQ